MTKDLKGYLSIRKDLQGKLETVPGGSRAETYKGETEVTPKISTQMLETAGKLVEEDITVHPIPYAEVSNNFGGKTVTIGG